jgi:hypothetical protein
MTWAIMLRLLNRRREIGKTFPMFLSVGIVKNNSASLRNPREGFSQTFISPEAVDENQVGGKDS